MRTLEMCPKCGSGDVGAASGIAHCYKCKDEVRDRTTPLAVERWNIRAVFMRYGLTADSATFEAVRVYLERDRAMREPLVMLEDRPVLEGNILFNRDGNPLRARRPNRRDFPLTMEVLNKEPGDPDTWATDTHHEGIQVLFWSDPHTAPGWEPHRANAGEDAMQAAARDLPDGYGLEVNLENGAGWIDIYHNGEVVDFEEDVDARMTQRIRDATAFAIEHAKEAEADPRDAFEAKFPKPPNVHRINEGAGAGYGYTGVTEHAHQAAQMFLARWEGWKASKEHEQ